MTVPSISRTLVIVLLANVVATLLLLPTVRALSLPGGPSSSGMLMASLWGAALFSPLVALLKTAAFSLIIWASLSLWGLNVGLWDAFRPVLAGEIILALKGPWAALVLLVRGGSSIADLVVPSGINAFVDVPAGLPTLLAEQAGLFHVVWVMLIAVLLSRRVPAPRPALGLALAACWLAALGGALIRANFSA
ncbi:MAG: hypothetical protein ACYC1S_13355 [Gemmatimonadaceae bacterium]